MDQCRFTKFNTFLYQSYNNPPGASQADFFWRKTSKGGGVRWKTKS
uniref:Uncharacterized protein n=1 Tax=Siphoviridae sp. ctQU013 TaxID=2826329 RepID=A0A8S5NMP8_9CAUD|nr:MAG TPA: hypothetical protein [Siphoviridae sp. ctQU013]